MPSVRRRRAPALARLDHSRLDGTPEVEGDRVGWKPTEIVELLALREDWGSAPISCSSRALHLDQRLRRAGHEHPAREAQGHPRPPSDPARGRCRFDPGGRLRGHHRARLWLRLPGPDRQALDHQDRLRPSQVQGAAGGGWRHGPRAGAAHAQYPGPAADRPDHPGEPAGGRHPDQDPARWTAARSGTWAWSPRARPGRSCSCG